MVQSPFKHWKNYTITGQGEGKPFEQLILGQRGRWLFTEKEHMNPQRVDDFSADSEEEAPSRSTHERTRSSFVVLVPTPSCRREQNLILGCGVSEPKSGRRWDLTSIKNFNRMRCTYKTGAYGKDLPSPSCWQRFRI